MIILYSIRGVQINVNFHLKSNSNQIVILNQIVLEYQTIFEYWIILEYWIMNSTRIVYL